MSAAISFVPVEAPTKSTLFGAMPAAANVLNARRHIPSMSAKIIVKIKREPNEIELFGSSNGIFIA